ncbi:hypothetical protein Xen7305DRAFT_00045060 [Xenococcus sp. PCC 7305]|uniref:hypothetical protein n=1 Tax=Xenococcus sp. PCC 7305 TaxID=102125 RepID=UPI0002AC0755|nr:hypothetical protein [Xenococcus sp. PCC 7305]ELS04770.1 hypothetical protein Xen7305DRAFT_00045060 [Xenococcus sp. PCC 7305]
MNRIVLLGIVAVGILIIAPITALRSLTIEPNKSPSKLLTRTIFDVAEEGIRGEEVIERREEKEESGKLEERRDDAREWAER